ncbi:MAG: tRNA pseudouridine(38-40) synthase TruA [Dehalococcoidales bacterium]|jgi:tRNA pseudouridine38-40 synthase|nr:tRNA pseudouridine(38-40) synthase TruA [Dehalococcoidales bacterium]MDD3264492.1 tRNA pseudouridine(38-40) synthase TruA [Dehalococcoidales bacterium]MDD4322023.1 tRNA pseudouridine(38-40) synthase TruA [Dehalococcoidales bacterium]MDD5122064.1 tRNA pseudouridine(38-40) synthase TruA [Dehalococcoidales bacterium]MDD5498016.1 tRNA pseudouridine(38-40) synthase TruA [Dehalococcoidales bacterium]
MVFALLQSPDSFTGDYSLPGSAQADQMGAEVTRQFVLVVEYDGTRYAGFQLQKNLPTIQGELENALEKLTGNFSRVYGSSRTDSGVHALGQVISFKTSACLKTRDYIGGMNFHLPDDISVIEAYRVREGFDVRRRAISRSYRYCIINRGSRSPIREAYTVLVRGELDVEAMDAACGYLEGTHDFASFASPAESLRSTTRRVIRAGVIRQQEDDLVIINIEANAFLPHQVRNTVGPLIKIGRRQMTPEDLKDIMNARTVGLAQPTAPAKGLTLYRVNYTRELKEESLE